MKRFMFVVIIVAIYSSCSREKGELNVTPIDPNSCDTTNIKYNDTIKNIITTKCAYTGCHVSGGSGNGDFSTHTGVQMKVTSGSFETRVLMQKNMPPASATIMLSDCDRVKLQKWINKGALND